MRSQRLFERDALLRQPQHAAAPRDLQEALFAEVHAVLRLIKRPARAALGPAVAALPPPDLVVWREVPASKRHGRMPPAGTGDAR